MKYQTITVTSNATAFSSPPQVGWDRLSFSPKWEAFTQFRNAAIENGDLDRYWGSLDSVEVENDNFKKITVTYNTLAGAMGWYMLTVDENNNPRKPEDAPFVRVVEIDDHGNVVSVVRVSNNLTSP